MEEIRRMMWMEGGGLWPFVIEHVVVGEGGQSRANVLGLIRPLCSETRST